MTEEQAMIQHLDELLTVLDGEVNEAATAVIALGSRRELGRNKAIENLSALIHRRWDTIETLGALKWGGAKAADYPGVELAALWRGAATK